MKSREAVESIARHRGDAIVVCTMTTIKWLNEISPSEFNLSCVPLMGGASGLALGLAIGCPQRQVIVLDGDGSLLMQLGTLVTIADAAPTNLHHMVFCNGVWFENMANLDIPGKSVCSFSQMASAAGYVHSERFSEAHQLEANMARLLKRSGPQFIELEIEPDADALWNPMNPQPDLPDAQFNRMGQEARKLKSRLVTDRNSY